MRSRPPFSILALVPILIIYSLVVVLSRRSYSFGGKRRDEASCRGRTSIRAASSSPHSVAKVGVRHLPVDALGLGFLARDGDCPLLARKRVGARSSGLNQPLKVGTVSVRDTHEPDLLTPSAQDCARNHELTAFQGAVRARQCTASAPRPSFETQTMSRCFESSRSRATNA